jgi:hypothetical protein
MMNRREDELNDDERLLADNESMVLCCNVYRQLDRQLD